MTTYFVRRQSFHNESNKPRTRAQYSSTPGEQRLRRRPIGWPLRSRGLPDDLHYHNEQRRQFRFSAWLVGGGKKGLPVTRDTRRFTQIMITTKQQNSGIDKSSPKKKNGGVTVASSEPVAETGRCHHHMVMVRQRIASRAAVIHQSTVLKTESASSLKPGLCSHLSGLSVKKS